jgi:prepilin-type N-terminal cleavage/methylation domain-containing protein/prepilin-type processing-associated H-X9-DG protein
MHRHTRRRPGHELPAPGGGFSLVELLVVLGIVGLLLGILLPSLSQIRASSQRIACRATLADLGRAWQMYLNDSGNKLPRVDTMPSLELPPLAGVPSLPELFASYTGQNPEAWHCRRDQITRHVPGAPEGFETYFEREGSSYTYNPMLAANYPGRDLRDHPLHKRGQQNTLEVMYEYEPFHGRAGKPGSMNYLFADWHVGDLGL